MKSMIYFATALLSGAALCACNDDDIVGDPAKDWSATTQFVNPVDEPGFSTYYTPAIGTVGDPMPFFDPNSKTFKVLYLQEYASNDPFCFHPIWGIETSDCANYRSMGEVLATGSSSLEQDAALGTGCCYYCASDKLYYIYYTGHNGSLSDIEVVMRATSSDFKTWKKDASWSLRGLDFGYSNVDFRDPQIFEEGGKYHMIIATKPANGGDPCFAEFVSSDMKNWEKGEQVKMIWDRMLECPDIFQMGKKWYCVYSESVRTSWSRKVKYMVADSWDELKKCFNEGPKWPADDREGVLDSRALYAAKTAANGEDRYIWGWSPRRIGGNVWEKNVNVGAGDGNEPAWSGSLVCHRLVQHEDGTLSVGEVPGMEAKYSKTAEVKIMEQDSDHTLYNRLGYHNHISFKLQTATDADRWGVSFVRTSDTKKYYSIICNPEWENGRRKFNFEEEGEEGKHFIEGADGYIMPRPADNTYQVDIYTDNSVVVIYVNGEWGCTQRIYGIQNNCWSINNYGCNITVSDLKVTQY